jgi:hypothetical protein
MSYSMNIKADEVVRRRSIVLLVEFIPHFFYLENTVECFLRASSRTTQEQTDSLDSSPLIPSQLLMSKWCKNVRFLESRCTLYILLWFFYPLL